MKVQFLGNVKEHEFEERILSKLEEVVESTLAKLDEELGITVEGVVITEAEFTLGIIVEGEVDPQVLTVEHHEGQPEMFKWIVDVDLDVAESNEEDSFIDEWTASMQTGKEKEFAEIASVYDSGDFTLDNREKVGNMEKITLNHKDGFKVVKVYQNDKLIQEYKLIPKDPETK